MSGNAALAVSEQSPQERIADLEAMLANQSQILQASEDERKRASKRVVRLARLALTLEKQRAAALGDLARARATIEERDDRIEELESENGDLEDELNDLRSDNEDMENAYGRLRDGLPDLVRARGALKAGKADDGRHELERFLDGLGIEWTCGGSNVGALL
jgi:chromosome segregation ATPase